MRGDARTDSASSTAAAGATPAPPLRRRGVGSGDAGGDTGGDAKLPWLPAAARARRCKPACSAIASKNAKSGARRHHASSACASTRDSMLAARSSPSLSAAEMPSREASLVVPSTCSGGGSVRHESVRHAAAAVAARNSQMRARVSAPMRRCAPWGRRAAAPLARAGGRHQRKRRRRRNEVSGRSLGLISRAQRATTPTNPHTHTPTRYAQHPPPTHAALRNSAHLRRRRAARWPRAECSTTVLSQTRRPAAAAAAARGRCRRRRRRRRCAPAPLETRRTAREKRESGRENAADAFVSKQRCRCR
jgi:hypothetical protein